MLLIMCDNGHHNGEGNSTQWRALWISGKVWFFAESVSPIQSFGYTLTHIIFPKTTTMFWLLLVISKKSH
jgi:hypothetical protein